MDDLSERNLNSIGGKYDPDHTVADTGALELTFIEVYRFKDRTCHTVPTNSASGAASQISVSASN